MTYLVNDDSHLFILKDNEQLLKTLAINFYAHAYERTNVCSEVRIFDLQETITDLDGVAYWKEDRE